MEDKFHQLSFLTNGGVLKQVEVQPKDYVYLYNPVDNLYSDSDSNILNPKNWIIGQFDGITIDEERAGKKGLGYRCSREMRFEYEQVKENNLINLCFIPADDFNIKDMKKSIENIVVLINDEFYKGVNPLIRNGYDNLCNVQDEQAKKAGII